MFSNTRTTIIAVIAAAGFATSAVAPAVSQARAISPGTKAALCETLRLTQGLFMEAAEAADEKGEPDMAAYYRGRAERAEGEAGNYGCVWEITIDATHAAGKVKAIRPPSALAPAKARTTTSVSAVTRSAASAR
jgi:hypothetical protein